MMKFTKNDKILYVSKALWTSISKPQATD